MPLAGRFAVRRDAAKHDHRQSKCWASPYQAASADVAISRDSADGSDNLRACRNSKNSKGRTDAFAIGSGTVASGAVSTVAPSTAFRLTPAVHGTRSPKSQCDCDTMAGLLNAGAAVGAVGRGGRPCPSKSIRIAIPCVRRGTKAVSSDRSVPYGRKRSGPFASDFRSSTTNAIWRCLTSPSTASFGAAISSAFESMTSPSADT